METAPGLDNVVAVAESQLPVQIVAALNSADPAHLRSLLTTLACSLDLPSRMGSRREVRRDEPIRRVFDQQCDPEIAVAAQPRRAAPRQFLGPIAAHVLLPMTLVTSALVALMAWIR